ncbi:MAG: biopolymer transporter ExbD [Burkholderiales bacterium PBB2]|uniref:ExbD/TolR family protein n=1 Tax=Paucibacter sp. DJ1R-11 TaxID=2893556 RepID=UPI000BDAEB8F|nr:biopolymer transporter ExbD [Paucibacter sp. DJ1R-11]MCV2362206.1 biopolymer transporter ExbD [Paucibacter sp. DJ1R-11]OYU26594.1 MAG: biopolymer transporter ExbD [Burkholderiales bacterium PBB2]
MSFGRLERRDSPKPMGDINMTPLIDVMLVLLVIFMIAAPLMSNSLRLDLPKSEAATPGDTPQFIALAVAPDGSLYLGEEKLDAATLQQRLKTLGAGRPELEVQLRADQAAPYGAVAQLIGWCQAAGLHRMAFVTDADTATAPTHTPTPLPKQP